MNVFNRGFCSALVLSSELSKSGFQQVVSVQVIGGPIEKVFIRVKDEGDKKAYRGKLPKAGETIDLDYSLEPAGMVDDGNGYKKQTFSARFYLARDEEPVTVEAVTTGARKTL